MPSVSAEESSLVRHSFKHMKAVSLRLETEDMVVVAYDNSRAPSVILTRDGFSNDTSQNQSIDFTTVSLEGHEGYSIWCCEIVHDELRVCLVRK